MSVDNNRNDSLPCRSVEDGESPCKRQRTDISPLKSWSLMDKKTDYEVLQEMGVGLLDPEDTDPGMSHSYTSNVPQHKSQKRKHGIENVNPNVVASPRRSPKSPRRKGSSGKPRSPAIGSAIKETNLSISSDCLPDEETPLGQLVAAAPRHNRVLFSPVKGDSPTPGSPSPPGVGDSFAALSDEMMLHVFRWLPRRALARAMLVCKRWHRVANDETLWQRSDLGSKKLNPGALGRVLARSPLVLRLAASELGPWHPTTAGSPCRLQYLDLSMALVDPDTLDALLATCPNLRKLSLESVPVRDSTCEFIGQCSNLETLNLVMSQGITEVGLAAILDGCKNLQSLNIAWCGLPAAALDVLTTRAPPALARLAAGGSRHMQDYMVTALVSRCPRLLELDLSDCAVLGAAAVAALLELRRLEHLALSRCYMLRPSVLTSLSAIPSLQYLDVWGSLGAASLAALKTALPGLTLNQFRFSAIARPTVGTRRTSIWGHRTRE